MMPLKSSYFVYKLYCMDNEVNDEAVEAYLQEKERVEREDELARQREEQLARQREDELGRKKEFLKASITEVFDEGNELQEFANFFLNYLVQQKGIQNATHDLNLITFEELCDIIYEFKRKYVSQSLQILEPSEVEVPSPDIRSQMDRQFKAQKVYYSNGGWDYHLAGYEECEKVEDYFTISQAEHPKVHFSKTFTKKCGGFFGIWGKLELWVEVSTSFTKERVDRKIQDFMFLRKMLEVAHPGTFIPPLDIQEKELERVGEEGVKGGLLKECETFVRSLLQNQALLSNIFCFRFFKETSYDGYVNHRMKHEKFHLNQIRQVKNAKGVVAIEISDRNEIAKKDYSRTTDVFEKFWKALADSNSRISAKLSEVQQQVDAQKTLFDNLILEVTRYSQNFHSESYENTLKVAFCFQNVFAVLRDNLGSYQTVFDSINTNVALDSHSNWKQFTHYKNKINQIGQQYQLSRKVFLDKQLKKQESSMEKPPSQSPNQSVISEYGLHSNCEKEAAWIQRFAKWQGYLNCEFIASFERLLDSNAKTLTAVLQGTAEKLLSATSNQQKSLIQSISQIS